MTATSKPRAKAAPRGGAAAAARAEVKGEERTVTFRDLTLKLPAELPGTLLFDLQIIATSGDSPLGVMGLLQTLVGPEQFVEIRNAMVGADDVVDEVGKLIDSIFEAYGTSLGDS